MATEIVMPRLSDSMEEGTVLKWMKSVGDEVALGEELVEIETDKANMVFESDAAGTLIEILAPEGETLPIGEVIARVGDPSEAGSGGGNGDGGQGPSERPRSAADIPPDPAAAPVPVEAPPKTPAPSPTQPEETSKADGRVKASPLARRIAGEKGVDLHSLQGSGPGGRIIKADVET
ncbi:MAG TPA: biotin/lipoyl-containing protein, partial [Solirubrobacterales bacterium]